MKIWKKFRTDLKSCKNNNHTFVNLPPLELEFKFKKLYWKLVEKVTKPKFTGEKQQNTGDTRGKIL